MAAPATADAPPAPEWYREPSRVEVRGVPIAYRREGAGEPVLFLHSFWLTRRWTPFHAALAQRADVIAPELPGFGDSPPSRAHTTRPDMVLMLRDFLDRLDLESVHLVGYGLGAWLAADLAVWYPTVTRSLTVVSPFGLRVRGAPILDVFLLDPARYAEVYFGASELPGDLVPGVGTPAQGGAEGFAQRYGELGAAAAMMWDRRYDLKLEDRLPRLGLPALVVGGAQDRVVPAAHLDAWSALLDAQPLVVEDAGHAVVVQQPQALATAIADFVERSSR